MSLVSDSDQASEYLEHLQARLWEQGDHTQDDDLTSIMAMLDSPLFRQLLTLQESLQELKQVSNAYPTTDETFDISPAGELILNMPPDSISNQQTFSESAAESVMAYNNTENAIVTPSYDVEFRRAIEIAAEGREVETVKLFKPENSSLGFSVLGLKKPDNKTEMGIFVQDIQPGGIAARDGRLRERDQILAIDGQPLDISHQEAIYILQSARGLVELIVARGRSPISSPIPQLPEKAELPPDQPSNEQADVSNTDMVLNTEWTQIEVIELINDGTGLGFGIIGGRSTGVVVKTILPGGIADLNGRLHSGDHVLQIGDVNVRGMGSEQVAAVLRQSGSQVRLIVARPVPEPSPIAIPHAPIVPTHQLDDHLQQINSFLEGSEIPSIPDGQIQGLPEGIEGMVQVHMPQDYPEVEYFDVDLLKDNQGLGITIAGYVGRDNSPDELCGIFVKSIGEGSAAAQDGRIQVNDQIIQVDNQALTGFTNHQAVEVLRNTGQMVHLKLARYQHGPKFEKLQQYLAQPNYVMPNMPPAVIAPGPELNSAETMQDHTVQSPNAVDMEDIIFKTDEDYSGDLLPDTEIAIKACWEPIIGNEFEVVVAQLSKFREGGGLGISLEGTVDVENGKEVRPHHYIRSILPDGPVGVNGRLMSGDELLEVNGKRLLGLNHKEVVGILKDLPQHVRLVCARRIQKPSNDIYAEQTEDQFLSSQLNSGVNEVIADRLVKAKSEMALASVDNAPIQNSLNKMKSRSLEPLTNLAMWSGEAVVIELKKGDKGLGFSILDYQDPANPTETVIVIRSLVPGGVAQQDGRLVPGDRLIFVNEDNLENATLDLAVQALKGAPKGVVRIGVAKPLPLGTNAFQPQDDPQNATLPMNNPGYFESGYAFNSLPQLSQQILQSSENTHQLPSDSYANYAVAPSNPYQGEDVSSEEEPGSNKDSFYDSDEDEANVSVLSPSVQQQVNTKPITSPRTNIPQNVQPLEKATETTKKTPPTPLPRVSSIDSDSLVKTTPPKPAVDKFVTDSSPNSQSPEDYEAATLPSYEEALALELEMFPGLDVVPPPVPQRVESEHSQPVTVEAVRQKVLEQGLEAAVSSDEQSVTPAKSTEKKGSAQKRTPPPIPPKPTPPKVLQIQMKPKDIPPPLPASSPPQLTEASTVHVDGLAKISPRVPRHKKTESVDSSFSSSSDQPIPSDLKNTHSTSSTPRTMSPGRSPMASPSLMRTLSSGSDSFPPSLEKKIKLKKSKGSLGLTVEAVAKGSNGCRVKSLEEDGAISKDGRIQEGDYIVSFNNESMRKVTNVQARAIIRRASLALDIDITYISSDDAAAYKESAGNQPNQHSPTHYNMMPSPKIFPKHYRANLSPLVSNKSDVGSPPQTVSPQSSPAKVTPVLTQPLAQTAGQVIEPATLSPRQKSLAADGSPATGNQTWGPARTVELEREPNRGLGISIVGGRVDLFHVQQENAISGIFIKHVLDDSPAGKNGTLKTGDRILEVDGKNLRDASHDQAVDIIRNAKTPVKFVVQSLCDQACPTDLETDTRSVQSYDEANLTQQAGDVAIGNETVVLSPPVIEEVEDDSEDEDEYGYTKKRIQRRYGDLTGDLHIVDLKKGGNGLGISLAGNKDRNTMSVFVAGLQPESAAWKDGRIHVGDELLEVNGSVLYGRSHLNASAIIKGLNTAVVKIVLVRRDDNLEHMAVKPLKIIAASTEDGSNYATNTQPATIATTPEISIDTSSTTLGPQDVFQVITLQKGASGLGFAIVDDTRNGRQGIYIRSITPGGVAAQDGQLTVGDQILEVGDKPLAGVHYDKAIEILRNSQGAVRLKVRKAGLENQVVSSSGLSPQPNTVFHLENAPGESSTDEPAKPVTPQPVEDVKPHDPFTCPVIPGKETTIEIEKGRTGLGLSIVGGADTLLGAIIIHEVYEDGAAARDQRLWAGDQVLDVNGEDLREATHDYAIQVLRQTPSNVKITVFRDDNQVKEEDIYNIFSVELLKKPGRGLGLSIVGKRNDVGVYISDIVKGGVAEADGRLMQGDQILTVNNEDMRHATQEYAASVLKTTTGKVCLSVGRLKAGSRTSSRRNSNSPGHALKKSESSASNKSRGKHAKSLSEDAGTHIRVVELQHDAAGSLGLSIAGGMGSSIGDVAVMIANMTPGGPAAKSQKLKIGDKILQINDQDTDGLSHEEVVQLLKTPGTVTLHVQHGEEKRVSISGSNSRQVSIDLSHEISKLHPQDNVFDPEEDGAPPQRKTITLHRGPDGLGFSIVGGHGSPHGDLPIYVKNVFAKGAASEDGNLKRGDQILAVNGQSLEGCSHEEAVTVLKNAKGSVIMSVLTS